MMGGFLWSPRRWQYERSAQVQLQVNNVRGRLSIGRPAAFISCNLSLNGLRVARYLISAELR